MRASSLRQATNQTPGRPTTPAKTPPGAGEGDKISTTPGGLPASSSSSGRIRTRRNGVR